jgi:signal transduction histidine kinase
MRIRNALQSDMKTLSKFLDIMAHEIKNPLHAFGINLDVLKTKIDKDLPKADYMKHVKILEQEAEHLQEIIEGFLTYARPGVPRRERSTINMIVKNVCQMAVADAKKRNIKLETRLARSLPDVMIDRKQIQQALHNIVINAVHASHDGGKISIRSWINRSRVNVAVKDNGSGIPKEQLDKIFDLYFTTKKDGSGIGLPVTKRMVESNSGQIKFESKEGKGTEVLLSFPGV